MAQASAPLATVSPKQQALEVQQQMLQRVLSDDEQLQLARKSISTLEKALDAETVKGPNDTVVADHMARIRAAEGLTEVLGLRGRRAAGDNKGGVIVNVQVNDRAASWHPPGTPAEGPVVQVRVVPVEDEPA